MLPKLISLLSAPGDVPANTEDRALMVLLFRFLDGKLLLPEELDSLHKDIG